MPSSDAPTILDVSIHCCCSQSWRIYSYNSHHPYVIKIKSFSNYQFLWYSCRYCKHTLINIVIVGGGYLIITNLPPEEDYLTPEEVLANIDHYADQKITVRGYYEISGGYPVIVSTMSTTEGRPGLRFDYSNVENATDDLFTGEKYDFNGELVKQDTPTGFDVILVLDDFKRVWN